MASWPAALNDQGLQACEDIGTSIASGRQTIDLHYGAGVRLEGLTSTLDGVSGVIEKFQPDTGQRAVTLPEPLSSVFVNAENRVLDLSERSTFPDEIIAIRSPGSEERLVGSEESSVASEEESLVVDDAASETSTACGGSICGCEGLASHGDVAQRKQPVIYNGVCDLKYDPTASSGCQLKILELGNSLASKFSGCGEYIPKVYHDKYRLVNELDRGLLVDNKKITHDAFLETGHATFRPKQCAFPRLYSPVLHTEIAESLGLSSDGHDTVVLKLVNRCRGAGVVVTRTGSDLDDVLRTLLVPSDLHDEAVTVTTALEMKKDSMEEHSKHWWSNESPIFVAETCETSAPVARKIAGSNEFAKYCGTMRVGFVLIPQSDGVKYRIEFLGGYWKLPVAPVQSENVGLRCISRAKEGEGTASVDHGTLQQVYKDLQVILPDVFCADMISIPTLKRRYGHDCILFSFFLSRQASAMMRREQKHTQNSPNELVLSSEIQMLLSDRSHILTGSAASTPCRAARSHWERQCGVFLALQDQWERAAKRWKASRDLYAWNASSVHLLGLHSLRHGFFVTAMRHFIRSLALDPEWRATYINLSYTLLALQKDVSAKKVAQEGLTRYPCTSQLTYNFCVGVAMSLRRELAAASTEMGSQRSTLISKARKCIKLFKQARDQQESPSVRDWCSRDDSRLTTLGHLLKHLKKEEQPHLCNHSIPTNITADLQDLLGWNVCHFRP